MLDKYAETIALKSRVEQGSQGGFIDNPREVAEDLLVLEVPGWVVWEFCKNCSGTGTIKPNNCVMTCRACIKGQVSRPATQQEVNEGKAKWVGK